MRIVRLFVLSLIHEKVDIFIAVKRIIGVIIGSCSYIYALLLHLLRECTREKKKKEENGEDRHLVASFAEKETAYSRGINKRFSAGSSWMFRWSPLFVWREKEEKKENASLLNFPRPLLLCSPARRESQRKL